MPSAPPFGERRIENVGAHHYLRLVTNADWLRKARRPIAHGTMDRTDRLKRLQFRSEHRGVREADILVGGYFARWHAAWSEAEIDWFEALLEEQDADILAWAMGSAPVPARWQGEMMRRLRRSIM